MAMFDGHDTPSLAGNVAAARLICTETVTAPPASASTLNEVEYCPAGKPAVLKVKVRLPLLLPRVGDTVNQSAVGASTLHLRPRLPALLTRTVVEGRLLAALP